MNGANFQQRSDNWRWGSYGKNKLKSRTYKKLYLLWRKVDRPLRNVRSVCSPPSSALSFLPPSPHKLNCYSEKGKARWFWGLAVRKGPNFTSRLLNSSADWQRYRIWAIWELFGSLGPVPNEQVLTRKRLPVHRRCRHGALRAPGCYLGVAPSSPRPPPAPGNRAPNSAHPATFCFFWQQTQ